MRVLIVGCGIFGLSSALECVRRGMDVTLVDAGSIPCRSASSYDAHRLIRYPYGRHRGYARLIPHAYASWQSIWDEIGEQLYVETGTLAIGDASTGWIDDSVASLKESGIPYDRLTAAEARELFAPMSIKDSKQILFTSSGGVLLAERILQALSLRLKHGGARMLPDHAVSTDGLGELASEERADAVIITTGATRDLPAAFCSYDVTPTRQVVGLLTAPSRRLTFSGPGSLPMFLDLDETSGFYLVPSVAGTPAKIGDHRPGRIDAEGLSIEPTHDERRRLSRLFVSALDRPLPDHMTFKICRYAMTPDRRIVLRRGEPIDGLPDTRIIVAGGGSGHGFKFGPVIGKLIAAQLDGSLTPDDAERIAAGRVDRGETLYLR